MNRFLGITINVALAIVAIIGAFILIGKESFFLEDRGTLESGLLF